MHSVVLIQGTRRANTESIKGASATNTQRLASARDAWAARAPHIHRAASDLHLAAAQYLVLLVVIPKQNSKEGTP